MWGLQQGCRILRKQKRGLPHIREVPLHTFLQVIKSNTMVKHKKWQSDTERKCLVCGKVKMKTQFETYQSAWKDEMRNYMKWSCKSCPPLTSGDFKKKEKAPKKKVNVEIPKEKEVPKMPEKRIQVKKASSEGIALLYNIKYIVTAIHEKLEATDVRIEKIETQVEFIYDFMNRMEEMDNS